MKEIFSEFFSTPFHEPIMVFALLLFIILIVNMISKKFEIPEIIGLIVAGVLLGPNGFNLLANTDAVGLLSTVGLLYILFLVGLELDIKQFKANSFISITFGVLTFVVPFVITYFASVYILRFSSNVALMIACMFTSHTLVTYVTVTKIGITENRAIPVVVGGTVFTDILVLLLFSVLLKNTEGVLDNVVIIKMTISILLFFFIVFAGVPKFARWFFNKFENERYIDYIFVLFVVALCGILAEFSGVDQIIGAFLAGLALNKLIPKTSALFNRTEFIGNSFFIPIFLISVGMLIDVRMIFQGWTVILLALVLTFTAVSGKWLAAFFTQIFFKFSKDEGTLMFGLSSARASATLALVLIGFNAGVEGFDNDLLNATVLIILITCILSSIFTQRGAKKVAIEAAKNPVDMEAIGKEERILVPVANPVHASKLIELSLLVKRKHCPNPITILSVIPNNLDSEKNIIMQKKALEPFIKDAKAADIDIETMTTIDHHPLAGISRISREIMANVIILGWPGELKFFDRIFSQKFSELIIHLDKNIFICDIHGKLTDNKRMVISAPVLSEREKGFPIWLAKLSKLARELSLDVIFEGHKETFEAIKKLLNGSNKFTFVEDNDDTYCLTFQNDLRKGDILVQVLAHKGNISYNRGMEHYPSKFEMDYPNNSKIIIFSSRTSNNDTASRIF